MGYQSTPPKRIAVIAHPTLPKALAEANKLVKVLEERQIPTLFGSVDSPEIKDGLAQKNVDLAIVLGGDGTMLRTGHLCAPQNIPMMGINLGRFGFLIEVQRDQWMNIIDPLLRGEFRYEKRMMLWIEHWREKQKLGGWNALNEVVVCRGQMVRPVRVTASVDGRFLTTYVADGLIAATPTGSTAYALAAGGPILPPELRNILLLPVAPHLSMDRAIVLAEGACVSIQVEVDHQAVFSVDGQPPVSMQNRDRVQVSAGDYSVSLIRFQDPGYFYRNLTSHMEQNPSSGLNR
jgi:NAD+ kinase